MDSIVSILAICAILLLAGLACGLLDRGGFSVRWLLGGIALVALNDVLLTNFYGLLPTAFPQSEWNWQGKALALVATLAIAAHPAIGWQRVGLTFRQKKGSLKSAVPVALAYCAFFLAIAMFFPGDDSSTETIAFQLTMPSLEEESFYRGLLLFAFYEAFRGRVRVLGVDWSWGALLSCLAFGLAHAFAYSDGAFAFDPIYFALTAIPSALAVWMRLRTGSLLLPILLHSVGNALPLML